MKRLSAALIFLGLLAALAIGFRSTRISAQTTNVNSNLCSMPQTGTYSPGAVETRIGELYRCSFIFDSNLQASGVAWIKMTTQTVYVPKTQRVSDTPTQDDWTGASKNPEPSEWNSNRKLRSVRRRFTERAPHPRRAKAKRS